MIGELGNAFNSGIYSAGWEKRPALMGCFAHP